MARYPERIDGRRPLALYMAAAPTCWRCTWVFRLRSLLWELKFIHMRCLEHRGLPVVQPAEAFLR